MAEVVARSVGYRAHRQWARTLRPLARAATIDELAPIAELLLVRIRYYRHKSGAGTWVLADEDGQVYVLSDNAATTVDLVARHMGWLVGLFDLHRMEPGQPPRYPSAAELRSALICHLASACPRFAGVAEAELSPPAGQMLLF